MSFTFIHTADWQIGKPFGEFAGDKPGVLRQERLNAIDRIADIAHRHTAGHILVAGDVFDFETGAPLLVRQLVQRLAAHRDLAWHMISGNHDPARASSVWEDVRAAGLPANLFLHMEPRPAEIAPGVVLLPAPLKAKSCIDDPTAWMDQAPTPTGAIRIGMAHGSITGFGSEGDAAVPIDPSRPRAAGLSFLALGDWHGTKKISDRVWYSGTPEPDGFSDNEPGHVLAVTLDSATSQPRVERIRTATYTWLKREISVVDALSLQPLLTEISALGAAAQKHLLQVSLVGRAPLADHLVLQARLTDLEASLFHLAADLDRLALLHDVSDMAAFGTGAVRAVAERLARQADSADERQARIAAHALLKLATVTTSTAKDTAA